MIAQSKRSLKDVVGEKTYSVWVEMLRTLVPGGRTHRLSVVVAGMLQYALEMAEETEGRNEDEHSVAMSLIDAAESGNPDNVKGLLNDVMTRLFDDADVAYERVSKRGEHYSIADEVYNEYVCWFDYPWD